jgi:PadR family transcriptional regulator PadR
MGKGDYLGEFELIVLLAVLRLRENAYGMTIRREIFERTGRNASIGAVYTTLDRLEEKGYISSHTGEATPERGGRAKKYFQIRGAGETALAQTERTVAAMKKGLKLKPIMEGA